MASLGLHATELGPPGFLPDDVTDLKAALRRYDLQLVGAFVPVVMHDHDQAQRARGEARRVAQLLGAAGADVFVSAAVVDEGWAPRRPLEAAEWDTLFTTLSELDEIAAAAGLRHVLHPHLGTLVETADDVERVHASSAVHWCLDTGHLTIGGTDPVEFAERVGDRVGHVHLKDVDLNVAERMRTGDLNLVEAVQQGLFQPLGRGDVPVDRVVWQLESGGYRGWYVLEQDTAITAAAVPPDGTGPVSDVRISVEYLKSISIHPKGERVT
jgi:inosose dehydratase